MKAEPMTVETTALLECRQLVAQGPSYRLQSTSGLQQER